MGLAPQSPTGIVLVIPMAAAFLLSVENQFRTSQACCMSASGQTEQVHVSHTTGSQTRKKCEYSSLIVRMMWRSTLNQHLKIGEEKLVNAEAGKRFCRKERNNSNRPETRHKCDFCGRDCFFHIGLYSHKRRCNNRTDRTTRMCSHDQTCSTETIAYHSIAKSYK